MMHSLAGRRLRNVPFAIIATVMIAAGGLPGCASRVYRPSQLPVEYAASPAIELDTLNLANLAGESDKQDVICWGDLLVIEVDAGLPSLEPRVSTVRVAKDGTAKIPLIGRVALAGLEVEHAELAVVEAARSRNVYPNPFVSVRLANPRKNNVTIVGAVSKPGVYELPRGSSSLMAALVKAGGLVDKASGEVELRHTDPRLASLGLADSDKMGGEKNGILLTSHETESLSPDGVTRINLIDAASHGGVDHELQDGDVVNVIPRELPPIYVLGLVTKPGAFDMSSNRDVFLLDALALAGGSANPVADRVTIRRRVPGESSPVTIVASIRKAMDGESDNVLLAPGDTVMVRQTPETVVVDVIKTFVRVSVGSSIAMF
ncbi:MAG: SLBB domain-containing protein [Pirellulales bacterium]|nr:SLBB domain-containing protein [Pirellulales bacterium]